MTAEWNTHALLHDRYEIKSQIGQGGMGKAYLAYDRKQELDVVLKVLALDNLAEWKMYDLFKREVEVLRKIDHPQIPDYFDYFEIEEAGNTRFVLVQEYVRGKNLFQAVKEGRAFSTAEIRIWLEALLGILSYIHSLHPPVIHRDVNPKNIVLDAEGKVYLVDFGAAGILQANTLLAAGAGTFVGTLGFIAPEQLYGKALPASDIYSLGVTILYLLTGREAVEFKLDGLRLDYSPYITWPADLDAVIRQMIAPDTGQRFRTAEEALAVLKGKTRPGRGKTPASDVFSGMQAAIESGDQEQVAMLIARGVPLNPRSRKYPPFLKIALDHDRLAIARLLIKAGAHVNSTYQGLTPLHEAVIRNNAEQVMLLLEFGADPEIRDGKTNKAPMQFAETMQYEKIATLLARAGVTRSSPSAGRAALHRIDLSPPPRKLRFFDRLLVWKQRTGDLFSFGLGIFFFSLLFAFGFVIQARVLPALLLVDAQARATGTVTNVESTSSSINDVRIYKNTFTFRLEDGQTYSQHSFTTGKRFDTGQTVSVIYVTDQPQYAVIEGTRYSEFDTGMVVLLLVPMAGCVVLLLNRPWGTGRYIRLLRTGILAEAHIDYVRRRGKKYHYHYNYDDAGQENHGDYLSRDNHSGGQGDAVPILYLPGKQDISAPVQLPLHEAKGKWIFTVGRKGLFTALLYWSAEKLAYAATAGLMWYMIAVFI